MEVKEQAVYINEETCLLVQTIELGDKVYLDDKLIEKYDIQPYGEENLPHVCLVGLVAEQFYTVSIQDHVVQIHIQHTEFSKTIIIVICSIFIVFLAAVIGVVTYTLYKQKKQKKELQEEFEAQQLLHNKSNHYSD